MMFGDIPRSHYGAIVVDPPWSFTTYSAKGKGRSPENHYGCMTMADIKAMPVADLSSPDCALFLWVTDPTLPIGLEVMAAWGFTYKTVAFTWAKRTRTDAKWHLGCGYWTRANPEMCLLGTKGKPTRLARDVRQLVVAPVREHSRKPDEIRECVERLVAGPYLEMFARERRPGWDSWGNEVGKFETQNQASETWQQIGEVADRVIAGAVAKMRGDR